VSEVAFAVEGMWKQYEREGFRRRTMKQAILDPFSHWRRERFWALSDINLRVHEGETVGLIGANGAGKSTLLRLVAGLGRPTRGRVTRYRKSEAILTLGDTFDTLLTGRENAVSAAIIAGFTRKQAERKLDEIVAFAELEDFIDQPLRMYSDGMRLRLAFSVAVSVEPKILVIDEVLSVGDIRFQEKCVARLQEFKERGATIVLASHYDQQVQEMCTRAVWLAHGRMLADGNPDQVSAAYREAMRVETERRLDALPVAARERGDGKGEADRRFGTGEIQIVEVRVAPEEPMAGALEGGPPVVIDLVLESREPVEDPIVAVSLHRLSDGLKVLDVSTRGDGAVLGRLGRRSIVRLSLQHLDVEPGSYYFDVGVYERDWAYVYDYRWQAHRLHVGSASRGGGFGPARRWFYG
jgi:lipopolysaccharide transport system ATP-binding protein